MIKNADNVEPVPYNWLSPIRLLDEEIVIISKVMNQLVRELETYMPYHITFKVTITMEEAKLISYCEFAQKINSTQSGWLGRLDDKSGKFAMLWDENTIAPLLYGVSGGSITGAIRRTQRKQREITDIEMSILADYIIRCFISPIRFVFSNYDSNFNPRLDTLEYQYRAMQMIFSDSERSLVFTMKFIWRDETEECIESKCYMIFSQEFLRNFNWRQQKWQNLKK